MGGGDKPVVGEDEAPVGEALDFALPTEDELFALDGDEKLDPEALEARRRVWRRRQGEMERKQHLKVDIDARLKFVRDYADNHDREMNGRLGFATATIVTGESRAMHAIVDVLEALTKEVLP